MRHRPLCAAFLALLFLVFLMHGMGISLWGTRHFSKEQMEDLEDLKVLTGTVSERWGANDGYAYILKDVSAICDKSSYHLKKVRIGSSSEFFEIGTLLKAKGRFSFYEGASNPGGFDQKSYYDAEGISGAFTLKSAEKIGTDQKMFLKREMTAFRERLNNVFAETMGSRNGPVLSAMLTGEKSDLEYETKIDYTVSGLGHLLAISGLHVGIVGAAILKALLHLRMKRTFAAAVSAGILYLYCIFTGGHDSTLRAFIMFAVFQVGRCIKRSYDMASSLSLAGIILLLWRPSRAFTAGFLLSFGAAAAIAFVYPVFSKRFKLSTKGKMKDLKKRLKVSAFNGLMIWLCVSLVTIPIMQWFYYEIAVYGAAANILFVPMTSVILLIGIAGGIAGMAFPFLAKAVLLLPESLIFLQDSAGALLRRIPPGTYITGRPDAARLIFYAAGLFFLMFGIKAVRPADRQEEQYCRAAGMNKKTGFRMCAAGIFLMCLIFVRPSHDFELTALDVGQGDCNIITDGSGKCLLIDGGSTSSSECARYNIIPCLKSMGISVVDAAFVTHNDADHMNGILSMLSMYAERSSSVRIRHLFMPEWMKDEETGLQLASAASAAGTKVSYLSKGDTLKTGTIRLDVLFPTKGTGYTGNEGSLVIGMHYGKFSALYTGDLEGEAEAVLTETIGHFDYLKVAHHGSSGSTKEPFLQKVSPLVCTVSAPKRSIYNHPSPETIERIESAGAKWFQTGLLGAVTASFKEGKVTVKSYRHKAKQRV